MVTLISMNIAAPWLTTIAIQTYTLSTQKIRALSVVFVE